VQEIKLERGESLSWRLLGQQERVGGDGIQALQRGLRMFRGVALNRVSRQRGVNRGTMIGCRENQTDDLKVVFAVIVKEAWTLVQLALSIGFRTRSKTTSHCEKRQQKGLEGGQLWGDKLLGGSSTDGLEHGRARRSRQKEC